MVYDLGKCRMIAKTILSGRTFQRRAATAGSLQSMVVCWLILFSAAILVCHDGVQVAAEAWDNGETFSEDLFLRPLSDGKVLAHFYFKNSVRHLGLAAHHHVFPKAISQLARKFSVRQMELSFTQGRWDYERWGALDPIASSNAKPLGVELWAVFDVPLDQVDPTWRNLTHALSGLFCASINVLESPAMVSSPEFAFSPDSSSIRSPREPSSKPSSLNDYGWLRYGALSREAVCTENLTPWLKLLPCRDKAGISTLLDRPSIYRGHYHSLRVRLRNAAAATQRGAAGIGVDGIVLEQTLTLVLQPPSQFREKSLPPKIMSPSWTLSLMFGKPLVGSCPLAKSSHVLLEIEGGLFRKLWNLNNGPEEDGTTARKEQDGSRLVEKVKEYADEALVKIFGNSAFDLSPNPTRISFETEDGKLRKEPSVLLDYQLDVYNKSHSLDLGMLWKERISWPSARGPYRVSRFLAGSGNERGSVVIQLRSNYDRRDFLKGHQQVVESASEPHSVLANGATTVEATIFHLVPWYLRLYMHTLTAIVDGYEVPLREVVTRLHVSPAEDRLSPTVLEIQLQLCANISVLSLTVEFDKGFLHIDEHPPDANRGFDLPSALIRFPMSQTYRQYGGIEPTNTVSPFKRTLEAAGPVHIYSENLLVPLATPDFSMPYNVITFTCTILALYFGSLLNTPRRRIGEEERRSSQDPGLQGGLLRRSFSRYMEGKSERQKKMIRFGGVALVAIIAVAVNQVINMDAGWPF